VSRFFSERRAAVTTAGFEPERTGFDPGIGFGKTDAANIHLLREVSHWSRSLQIMIGVSRKSLIGRVLNIPNPKDRDGPSKMLELGAALLGAKLIRTHQIAPLRHLRDLLEGGVDG
jgi:dihydropteroate synthase